MQRWILCALTFAVSVSMAATDIQTLEKKVDALTAEIANMKEKAALPVEAEKSFKGLGPGASKVYYSNSPLSVGGYGEIIFQDTQGQGTDTTDNLRLIPYIGYRFTDKIIFNSELEIEHGGDEVAVEFAYIDFLLHEAANVRAGHVLIPFGITNLQHEPTLFPSVSRSEVERNIIPTTWHENGVLLHGEWMNLAYNLGVVNGLDLDVAAAGDLSSASWIRNGRQGGAQAKAENWAMVGRLEWVGLEDLAVGASYYSGKSSQGDTAFDAKVTMLAAHAIWAWQALKVKALYVTGELEDSDVISAANGSVIGEEAMGYYLEAQYNIWKHIAPASTQVVNIFGRYEEYDPHDKVDAAAGAEDETLHKKRTILGFNYLPVSNVILKVDYQLRENKAAEEADMFELGLGYVF